FDVVTLWHVLEHLIHPRAMLEAARTRLAPEGLLVVAVPNLDNLPMRLAYRVARGRSLPLYEAGGREPHLTHLDPRTLRALRAAWERLRGPRAATPSRSSPTVAPSPSRRGRSTRRRHSSAPSRGVS